MTITADLLLVVTGTAVSAGTAIAATAVWAFKAVVAKDVTPSIVKLATEANALTNEFVTFRESRAEERAEMRAVLKDLDAIVRNHDTRIAVLEQRRAS